MPRFLGLLALVGGLGCAFPSGAGEADVVGVEIRRTGPQTFSFAVTVRHDDRGWDHYADRWDVVAPGGRVLASRKLLHPHDDEQPFTRSLAGVVIARDIASVMVRAHDSRHGTGGKTVSVTVPHDE